MELVSGGIIVATARYIGESVVGVIYLLEFLGACRSFGGGGRDTIGVMFEGLSEMITAFQYQHAKRGCPREHGTQRALMRAYLL